MNTHPVDGVETLLPELFVTKHLLTEMADLNEECSVVQLLCQGTQHFSEQFIFRIVAIAVNAFAHNTAMDDQERWNPDSTDSDNPEHMTDDISILISYYNHVWLMTCCLFADFHKFTAMKEVGTWKFRHLLALEVDGCRQSIHVAKLRIISKKCAFFVENQYLCTKLINNKV